MAVPYFLAGRGSGDRRAPLTLLTIGPAEAALAAQSLGRSPASDGEHRSGGSLGIDGVVLADSPALIRPTETLSRQA